MKDILLCAAGGGSSMHFALEHLADAGIKMSKSPESGVTHLLLPVPSLEIGDKIRDGCHLEGLLKALSPEVTVIGGNLRCPELAGYRLWDLLQDPYYVSRNAAITAGCALEIAADRLPVVLGRCPVLVIGWGRIGKCLAGKLRAAGAHVTVAARKEADRGMLEALGYESMDPGKIGTAISKFRLIFNTAPAPVLSESDTRRCRPDCVKMDLASVRGIAGPDVMWARGLPGKYAPESAGALIAETVLRLLKEEGAGL